MKKKNIKRVATKSVKKEKVKVVVTGGAGFIGSHLTASLLVAGYDVHVVDNLSGGKRERVHPKATFHNVDIVDASALPPIFAGARYVFHLAALPRVQFSIEHPFESHAANSTGTLNVLVAATAAKVQRVIYSASSSAYGDQPVLPLVETMPASPKSPYGLQKYVGELQCRLWSSVFGLETVSLRYFNVYGPWQDPDGAYALVIGKFLKQRKLGEPITITGDGSQTRDFTHVSDVVRANMLAAVSKKVGRGEVMNIGAGRNCSINDVASAIGGPVVHIPARLEPRDTLADSTLAYTLIGWKPKVRFEKGIAQLRRIYGIKG